MIWQREVALPLRSDWLKAGKAVYESLAKKNTNEMITQTISPKDKTGRGAVEFLLHFLRSIVLGS